MSPKTPVLIVIAIIIIVTTVFLLLGVQVSRSISPPGGPNALPAVEVRAYQGNDLSSVNDFRENSIRGPQYVNISDYRLTVTGLTNTTDVYTYQDVLATYPHLSCATSWNG